MPNERSPKCLVTGATGFIGRPLVAALLQSGWQVNALSRHGGQVVPGVSAEGVDLATVPAPDVLLSDVDVVFHLAGLAHTRGDPADYEALNHRAALHLAQRARHLGVKHFVFISSVKAMGPPPADGHPRTEEEGVVPTDPYGLSKYRAEQALLEDLDAGGMAITIVRPALVYGVAARGNLELLWRASRWGWLRPPEAGGRSMLALPDLIDLLLLFGERPASGRHCYIACSEVTHSTRHIYDMMRLARDKRPGVSLIPLWGWRIACLLRDLLSRSAERTYGKIFGTERYSPAALERDLGWQADTSLDAVIALLGGEGA